MRTILGILFLVFSSISLAEKEQTVIVISMDGMTNNVWEMPELKFFQTIKNKGIKADYMTPVYQSTTYPGHVSMATGVHPNLHGILHNSFYDRKTGFHRYPDDANLIDVPPIWILSEQQNIRSGIYFWVGSETDWHGWEATYKHSPFDEKITEEEKIKQIASWLDMSDEMRPRLIMTYWDGIDSIGHTYGPDHENVYHQMVRQDQMLGLLFSELEKRNAWDYITLLVVSDHGMTSVNKYISVKSILDEIKIDYRLSSGPAVAHVFISDEKERRAAFKLLSEEENIDVYQRGNLPRSFHMDHPSRTGDLVVTTEAPFMLTNYATDRPKGMHGYDPNHKDMHAIFGALGFNVSTGNIGPIHQVDLAPTIAKLLGINNTDHMQGEAIELRLND